MKCTMTVLHCNVILMETLRINVNKYTVITNIHGGPQQTIDSNKIGGLRAAMRTMLADKETRRQDADNNNNTRIAVELE